MTTPYVLLAKVGAVIALAAALIVGFKAFESHVEARGYKRGAGEVQAAWDADKLRRSTQALADIKEVRATEQARTRAAVDNAKEVYAEQQKTKQSLAAERTRSSELHRALEASRVAAAEDRARRNPGSAAEPDRAAVTAGSLLEACRAEASSDAGELEDLATQVRGLLRAYGSLAP